MAKDNSRLHKIKQEALAIWDERFHPETEMSRLQRFLRFWVLVFKSFNRNRCPVHASSLSFATLLALIPMLAVAIGITSSLLKKQGEDQVYRVVDKMIANMMPSVTLSNSPPAVVITTTNTSSVEPTNNQAVAIYTNTAAETETNHEATSAAIASETNAPATPGEEERTSTQKEAERRIHEFIQKTRSGALGVTGAILLVLVGIRMLGSIESTFNDIWGVTRGRNWLSRIQIYCTATVVGPLLLVGAVALTSGTHLQSTQKLITKMPILGPMIFPTLTLLLIWLAFALFYQFIPNTKVRFRAAMVGAMVSGTVWHVNNLFGFLYVSRVVSNSRIYGSLGLVPVFMAGIYFSWYVLLFGAQVAYAFQNRALYWQERIAENVNQRGREFVAMRLMTCIGQRFQRGLRAPTTEEMSGELGIPGRLVQQVLQTLIAAHLVIEIAGVEPAYTPGRPLEQINAHHVLQAMRARGHELRTRDEPVREEVYGEFARIEEAEKQAASSITMLALVHRAEARLELAPAPDREKPIEVSLMPAPVEKPQAEFAPQPKAKVEIVSVPEPMKPDVPIIAEIPEPPKQQEETLRLRPVAEPMTDEERDFPL